jgi:hypothetical protein
VGLPFEQLMHDVAEYLHTEIRFERDIYSLLVPLPTGRYQEVAATIRSDPQGREIIDFVSTVGPAEGHIDPWLLLQANGDSIFSRVTVARQIIFVVASQLLPTAQPEEVLLMLREVADLADRLEHELYQADRF